MRNAGTGSGLSVSFPDGRRQATFDTMAEARAWSAEMEKANVAFAGNHPIAKVAMHFTRFAQRTHPFQESAQLQRIHPPAFKPQL